MLLDIRSMLRRHREEKAGDLYSLARRLAASESIGPSTILETLGALGADDDALADAVELVSRRDELRRVAAQGPAAHEELIGLRGAISKHKAELDAAEEKYRRAISPLAKSEETAQARTTAAAQAESALLHPANLPSQIHSRLEESRRELLTAEEAVHETESLIARQQRRGEEARATLDEFHGGAAKALAAFADEDSSRNLPADRRELVLNMKGGTHQAKTAREKLVELVRQRDIAQAAYAAAERDARNF
jgi:chromosome segregation ATPase